MTPAHVLLLTPEQETLAAVRSVLQGRSLAENAVVCDTMMDLRTRLSRDAARNGPRIAVVDIDEDPERILSDLGKTSTAYPHTWFVVMSKGFEERHVQHAMQAGARRFLRKNAIVTELDDVLEHLLVQRPQAATRLGVIVSIFACSGGCGATTTTINLANELRLALAKRVLILDLDPHYGAVAAYLGLKGRYGIGHILGRSGIVDGHLIESTAATYCEGLDVLLSPAVAEADTGTALPYENLPAALEACREAYDYIFVDAPRVTRQVMANLASLSRMNVIVLQLTIRDVAYAGATVSFLAEQGVPRERILPLANRVRRRGPLVRLEDSRRVIGIHALHPIRSDWAKVMKSINRSRPLADVASRSRLRRDYRRLAERVHQCTSNGNQ
jgi:pilus assembly protein CpaE